MLLVQPLAAQKAAVLEDFSNGMRTNDAGADLWINGANPHQTMSIEDGKLRTDVSAVAITSPGNIPYAEYFWFYPLYNSSARHPFPNGFAQYWLMSGTWSDSITVLRGEVSCSVPLPFSTWRGFSLGTYIKNNNPVTSAEKSSLGWHYYQQMSFQSEANQPIAWRAADAPTDSNSGTSWGRTDTFPADTEWMEPMSTSNNVKTGVHFWAGATRFYMSIYGNPSLTYPHTCYWDNFVFEVPNGREPTSIIRTMVLTYLPSQGKYEVGWNTGRNVAGTKEEIRYSTSGTMKPSGFESGTPAVNNRADEVSAYTGHHYQFSLAEQPDIWVAIRPKIAIQSFSGGSGSDVEVTLPSYATSPFRTGDTVVVEGVSSELNKTWTITQSWDGGAWDPADAAGSASINQEMYKFTLNGSSGVTIPGSYTARSGTVYGEDVFTEIHLGPEAASPPAPLSWITPPSPPAAKLGIPYSQPVSCSGGSGNIAYSIVAGSLPDGLTLNTIANSIEGIPAVAGSFAPTLRCADEQVPPQTADRIFSIEVATPDSTVMSRLGDLPGSSAAILQYWPHSSGSCTVTVNGLGSGTGDFTDGGGNVSRTTVLSNLSPDTDYAYQVTCGLSWGSGTYRTAGEKTAGTRIVTVSGATVAGSDNLVVYAGPAAEDLRAEASHSCTVGESCSASYPEDSNQVIYVQRRWCTNRGSDPLCTSASNELARSEIIPLLVR
jgi:Putative Ig domain